MSHFKIGDKVIDLKSGRHKEITQVHRGSTYYYSTDNSGTMTREDILVPEIKESDKITVSLELTKKYEDAREAQKLAERELFDSFKEEFIKFIKDRNIDAILHLVNQLPKHYNGCRRLYQAIIEIEDPSTIRNHDI